MRTTILMALLLIVLTGIPGCSGTHTCTATGLTANQTYQYGYYDSDGNAVIGEFEATGSTFDVPGVDSSVDCASIGIIRVIIMPEYPVA
ncbi:MAG: hypothetical protein H7Z16_15235 [Pyrinomonadaceae bacterium]|nr:hypothetical protein [Pyrinomonadaceae bacterium]